MPEDDLKPYEYEVDLRDYFTVIWDNKWIILLVVIIAAGAAYGFTKMQPVHYETRTSLLITPRISEQIVRRDEGGLSTVSLPARAYERSALSAGILQQVIKDLGLKNEEGELIKTASLKGRIEIDVDMEPQQTSNGSSVKVPLITMSVRGQDPQEIRNIANKWAELFQQKTTQLFSMETARSFQFISSRFQAVEEDLRSLEDEKAKYLAEHPLNVLKRQVSVLEKQYSSFLSQLQTKKAELDRKESRLATMEEEYRKYDPLETIEQVQLKQEYKSLLAELDDKRRELQVKSARLTHLISAVEKEQQFLNLDKSVSKEAIWQFLLGEVSEEKLRDLPGLEVSDEVKNNVYFSLKNDLETTKVQVNTLRDDIPKLQERIAEINTDLDKNLEPIKVPIEEKETYIADLYKDMKDLQIDVSSIKKEVSYLEEKTEELKKKVEQKQVKIDEVQLKIEQFNRDIDRHQESYKTLSSNLEEARIAKEEKESSIRIMDEAVAPEKPLGTNTKQNVAVAGVLGLFIGVLVAFFKNYMEGYGEEQDDEDEDEKKSEK